MRVSLPSLRLYSVSESRMSSGSLFMLVISYMLLSFRHKRQFRDRTCFRTLLLVVVFERSHPESSSSDVRVVARIHSLNDVGCDSDSLNVTDDIVDELPRHSRLWPLNASGVARNPLVGW